jgi:hypothetical protein
MRLRIVFGEYGAMKQRVPAVAITLAVALAVLGCSGNLADGAPPVLSSCSKNSDCPSNFVCANGGCDYVAPECTANADCAAVEICFNGNCATPCASGCPGGFLCDATTGICEVGTASGGGSGGGTAGGSGGGTAGGSGGGTAGGSGGGTAGGSGGGHAGGSGGGSGGGTGGGSGGGTAACTPDTWANFARASFSSNCVSCHSHDHSAYSTYANVYGDRSGIKSRINSGNMPQGGWATSSADRARIITWLGCGAPQ